jgi:hypothetical protein
MNKILPQLKTCCNLKIILMQPFKQNCLFFSFKALFKLPKEGHTKPRDYFVGNIYERKFIS